MPKIILTITLLLTLLTTYFRFGGSRYTLFFLTQSKSLLQYNTIQLHAKIYDCRRSFWDLSNISADY